MSLTGRDNGGSFTQLEPNNYAARCIKLIDIGTQLNEYEGVESLKATVLFIWELPEDLIESGDYEGQPYTHTEFYTNSLDKKAKLREHLQGWRGKVFTPEELKGFVYTNVLGHPCDLSLGLSNTGKIRVKAINRLRRQCPPQVNPSIAFNLDDYLAGDPEQEEVFKSLSEGYQGLVKKSAEYIKKTTGSYPEWYTRLKTRKKQEQEEPAGDDLPDIPF
jgi:hypothetical protein